MKQLLLIIIYTILSLTSHAIEHPDSICVSGTVVFDDDDDPMIGCCVFANSSRFSNAITDINGAFSIKIPANSTLSFKLLGMQTEEIKLGENDVSNLQIRLQESCDVLIDWAKPPTIELYVKDKNARPIKDATVSLINLKTRDVIVDLGTTNKCGFLVWFNDENVKKSKYGLLIESPSRKPKIVKVNLKKKHLILNIQLDAPLNP